VSDSELVHLDIGNLIGTITLDSPHNRNALSQQLLAELDAHLRTAASDDRVRGVVLTGTGNTFCAGADLSGATAPGVRSVPFVEILEQLWHYPKTVVARVNGHVRAGGTGLVAAADIVIAPTSATFAFSEVRIGVAPAIIAVLCQRRMPPRAASRYMLTGEVFDAKAAVDAGLVTIVVEPDELDAVTAQVLDAVRLTEPNAVAATRGLLVDLPTMTVGDGLRHAETISTALFESPEAAEGIAAFREKRPPKWAPGG
jgi:enoyl-CoA hydratase/carnithine racemase